MTRAILLVDHGSRREAANVALEAAAEAVRARAAEGDRVAIAHMEIASPTIPEAIAALGAEGVRALVVVPWMLSPGRHAREDVPRIAREAAAAAGIEDVRVAEPLGGHPALADVALQRVREAEG